MFSLFNNYIANDPKPTTAIAAPVAAAAGKPVSNGYKFNFDLSFLGEVIHISLFKDEQ